MKIKDSDLSQGFVVNYKATAKITANGLKEPIIIPARLFRSSTNQKALIAAGC